MSHSSLGCVLHSRSYCPSCPRCIPPSTAEWNGEGLPPVGTVCEWKEKVGFSWVKATVLFITDCSVVMQREDGFEWQMMTARTVFRPSRTPEQIAAEEREKAINQMLADAQTTPTMLTTNAVYFGALYDAGYRKKLKL